MEQQFNLFLMLAVCIAVLLLMIPRLPFSKSLALLVFGVFLLYAPPTALGKDFSAYKFTFENLELIKQYPYVLTNSVLTSERGFLLYLAPFSLITNNFNIFLALNFILLASLSGVAFKRIGLSKIELKSVMIFSFAAIIPVIFYWSPRSGPSIMLILFSYHYFFERKLVTGLFFAFMASLIHSQYIPFIAVMALTMLIKKESIIYHALSFSVTILVILKYGTEFLKKLQLGDLFSVAIIKLHQFDVIGERAGVRPAGIGIILLCLIYIFFLRNKVQSLKSENNSAFIRLLDICIPFSLVANILFIEDSHLAGRIARFSDYLIIAVGIGYGTKLFFRKKYLLPTSVISFILLLFLYKNIYFISIE